MNFEPTSKDDLQKMRLLPDGEYDFDVMDAEDTTSKKGNGMVALTLRVFKPDGSGHIVVSDWLVASESWMCKQKIYNFCATTGKMDDYEAGTLDAFACTGAAGRLRLTTQEQEGYAPKNSVKDYIDPANQRSEKPERSGWIDGVPAGQAKRAQEGNDALESIGDDFDNIPF